MAGRVTCCSRDYHLVWVESPVFVIGPGQGAGCWAVMGDSGLAGGAQQGQFSYAELWSMGRFRFSALAGCRELRASGTLLLNLP